MMNAVTEHKADTQPAPTFREQIEQRLKTFQKALPPHITPERFTSIIMWAVTADPALLAADRASLFEACLAAANDGLLPDKKEAALVVYNTKVKEGGKEFWIKKVQYMPMIRGIFTKLYNTDQVKTAKVGIVYAGDIFRVWTDDSGDHIQYEEGEEQDRDAVRAAFALVVMKDGGVFVETMKPDEIEKIRGKSKASNSGPWVDWWEEMAKKSVFRRLAKRLPMSRDLDAVVGRDDALYDAWDGQELLEQRRGPPIPPRPPAAMLGQSAARPMAMKPAPEAETVDASTGEVIEQQEQNASEHQAPSDSEAGSDGPTEPQPAAAEPSAGATAPPAQPADGDPIKAARARGAEARAKGLSRKAVPQDIRKDEVLTAAYFDGFDTGQAEDRDPGEEG